MITVSSITKNTGRYAMIHTTLFIFLWTLFSIYHMMLLAICTTEVKNRVKKKFKKRDKKYSYEKFASRGFKPGPSESVRTKSSRLCPLDLLGKRWLFRVVFYFRVELNLSLTEAKRKAHNKPINTLSGLVQAGERLWNLWIIDRAATDWTVWPYDSLPACKVSFHRSGKTLTQHCSSLFPLL